MIASKAVRNDPVWGSQSFPISVSITMSCCLVSRKFKYILAYCPGKHKRDSCIERRGQHGSHDVHDTHSAGEAGAVEALLPGSTGSRRCQYDEFLDLRPQAELPLLSGTRRILQ